MSPENSLGQVGWGSSPRGGIAIVHEQSDVYKGSHCNTPNRVCSMAYRTVISVADLAADLGRGHVVVLDCRFDLGNPEAGRAAWLDGHIPGAVHADLDRDLSGPVTGESGRHPLPEPARLADRFGAFGIGPEESRVVCYDQASGAVAARAWWLLRWLGHEHVAVLDGGYTAWQRAGGAVSRGEEMNLPQRFVGEPAADWVVSTPELVTSDGFGAGLRLVDAREAARFRGEEEPIDPVAGRVPGSRNLYFGDTLRDDRTLKDPTELRGLFATVLDGELEAPWSVMCGSGVTACQLAVAAAHAGLRPPRVYVGSFSEWIRDPGRPVVTGPE